MSGIQRVGDVNTAGGKILVGDPTVKINGRAIAYTNAPVSPHSNFKPPHTDSRTRAKQSTVKVNGRAVVTNGCVDTCGHPRNSGSSDVKIGG
jgi:uncharacterized Zn-binding protein involved in type VI secretion